MKILLLESARGAGSDVQSALVAAGHDVVRCHEERQAPFPCRALVPGLGCPLDRTQVDVAVLVRMYPMPRPTSFETGVVCAIRERVSLVVAGQTLLNPYERWVAAAVDGRDPKRIVEAVEALSVTATTLPERFETP